MENFDLSRLSTDRDVLSKVLRSFVELQTKIAKMESQGDSLRIFGHGDGRKFHGSVTTNYLTAVFEYLGDEDHAYIKPEELIRLLGTKQESKFLVPGYAQPLGWEEELMERGIRGKDGANFDPKQLKEVLSYLLRLDLSKSVNDYFGIIFQNNEMITTNGQLMLIQTGMPIVTTSPRLLGYDSALALYSMLRTPYVAEVQMGVAKKSAIFGIRVELDDGSEMFFWSKPRYGPVDNYKDPRPPVTPNSVGFLVSNVILESMLDATMRAVIDNEKPVLEFSTTSQSGLLCTSYGTDESGIDKPRTIYQGTVPFTRSMGTEDVVLRVRADNLLQAIKGMGENTQFIVPQHPILGLQIHPIEPFYVNCNQNQFALLAPFLLERDKLTHLEKLKRKANNAMETL